MNAQTPYASNQLDEAMTKHRAGEIAAAAAGYESVLAQDPSNFDALHFLGVILLQFGNVPRAVALLEHAVGVHPEAFPAIHQLGNAFVAAGRIEDAATQFLRATAIAPDYAPAHESLAKLWHEQGRLEDAVSEYAIVARLVPESGAAHCNLGTTLGGLRRFSDALTCYKRALAINPQDPIALLNAANVLSKLGRPVEAAECFLRAFAQGPQPPNVWYQAGSLFYSLGMRSEAMSALEMALQGDPECVEAHWARMILELPLAYGPDEDPTPFPKRFSDAIGNLDHWFDAARTPRGHRAVGNQQPFYLAFHDVDVLPILMRYGDLCVRLMNARHPPRLTRSRRFNSRRPIRLAIASGFFYDQSVWTALVRGWCAHLDPRRIEIHLFHTGSVSDGQTVVARTQATSFHEGLTKFPGWVDAIENLEPDVLLYPEVGMDTTCAKLACLRLAPVQAVSWGHPVTTGLPTIDYYLSGELFEPPDGAAHYREQLVVLPNLGCYYEPLTPPDSPPDWNALGVDPALPRLVCAGTPYKYLPEHDHVFVEIAERLGRCQFLFFRDMAPHLTLQIEERMKGAFRRSGLRAADYVKFLPRQSRAAFFGLMGQCDVYLDTIAFSGFNSAMQAIECGLPVVTWERQFMRGRLAAGVLRRMQMEELVVLDSRAYVENAVRLCQELQFRNDTRRRIVAQRDILFRDLEPVRALEDFLVMVATSGKLVRAQLIRG